MDARSAMECPLPPKAGLPAPAQNARHFFQVLFRFVQKTVKADGSKVMGRAAERAKPKRDIEARFAHSTVALVIVGGKAHRPDFLTWRFIAPRQPNFRTGSGV